MSMFVYILEHTPGDMMISGTHLVSFTYCMSSTALKLKCWSKVVAWGLMLARSE